MNCKNCKPTCKAKVVSYKFNRKNSTWKTNHMWSLFSNKKEPVIIKINCNCGCRNPVPETEAKKQ